MRSSAVNAPIFNRRTLLGLLGLGAVAACTDQTFQIPSVAKGSLFYGAATPRDSLAAFEDQLGERLACYRSFFTPGEESQLVEQARSDIESGRVSWRPSWCT